MEIDSIVAYSLPGSSDFTIFAGKLASGLHRGFVISPFDVNSQISTIVKSHDLDWAEFESILASILLNCRKSGIHEINFTSTSYADYSNEVQTIIKELRGRIHEKTIACRRIVRDGNISVKNSLKELSQKLPNSFRFVFYTPSSGAWLGATPELLLEGDRKKLKTYALAGTRSASITGAWDSKNLNEHAIVVSYISSLLSKWGINPEVSRTVSRNAGNIDHLLTEINGDYSEAIEVFKSTSSEIENTNFLQELLCDLSPTPALCGMPKDESKSRIQRLENFSREYYGGFCGPYSGNDSFKFYVILRSLKFTTHRWCFYAGGGITCDSVLEAEWSETQRKSESVLTHLRLT